MSADAFEARLALLEEMLATAGRDVHGRAYTILESQRSLSHHEAGFAVALDVYAQWQAIVGSAIIRPPPLDMPKADEEGGCS